MWHFWGRFFDIEALSPQGDPQANVIQTLGILAVPSAFFVIVCQTFTLVLWDLVMVRYFFVSFSMIVMAVVMAVEWDALFLDLRDYQVLTPLPLKLTTLFTAKAAALAMFLGVFLLDINFFGLLLWPGIDGGKGLWSILGAHILVVAAAGLFSALAIAALQGVLVTVLSARAFQRISVLLQTLLLATLVMLLFLTPLLAGAIRGLVNSQHRFLYYFPGYWFVGLYEQLRPATGDPTLLALGRTAVWAFGAVATVFVLTYLPCYRRHSFKSLQTLAPNSTGPGAVRRHLTALATRTILRRPVQRAIFHFITLTITRSGKHRLFLAIYGGFGAALAVANLASGRSGLLTMPMTLSFILVSGLRAAFNFPSELRANWAFQISETVEVDEYLGGLRKWIVLCAVVPLFVLMAPIEFTFFTPTLALFHLAFGATLSVLLMDILFFDFRKIPFTCSHFPGKVNLAGLGAIYLLGLTLYSRAMANLESWLTGVPVAAGAFFALSASVHFLIGRRRRRALRGATALDYEDVVDPAVRTLDLTID